MVWLKVCSNYILCWSNNIEDLGSVVRLDTDANLPKPAVPNKDYTNNGTSSTREQRLRLYFNKLFNINIKWILLPLEIISETKNQWVLLIKP